jgi:hypothetical protein
MQRLAGHVVHATLLWLILSNRQGLHHTGVITPVHRRELDGELILRVQVA